MINSFAYHDKTFNNQRHFSLFEDHTEAVHCTDQTARTRVPLFPLFPLIFHFSCQHSGVKLGSLSCGFALSPKPRRTCSSKVRISYPIAGSFCDADLSHIYRAVHTELEAEQGWSSAGCPALAPQAGPCLTSGTQSIIFPAAQPRAVVSPQHGVNSQLC